MVMETDTLNETDKSEQAEPVKAEEKLQRWRLILGQESQKRFENMGGGGLTGEQDMMDLALAAIYNRTESGGFGPGAAGRGAGSGPSNPQITRWLARWPAALILSRSNRIRASPFFTFCPMDTR